MVMKQKPETDRIKELVEYLENWEMYEKLLDDIDKDIKREREKKKVSSGKSRDYLSSRKH